MIEILSPGTEIRDRGYKLTLYARHGVTEYWIVEADLQTLEVFTLGVQGYACTAGMARDAEGIKRTFPGTLKLLRPRAPARSP